MKTVLLALEFPPAQGGVETYYGKLQQYWPEKLEVITNHNNQLISPSLPIFGWLKGFFSFGAYYRREKPEWALAGEILPLGTILYLLSFIYSYKYGVFLHGLDFSLARRTGVKRSLTGLILNKANLIICANSYTAAEVKKCYPQLQRIEVVNPGVEPRAEANDLETTKNTFELLTIGRLVKRKGVDMTLRAIATLKKHIPYLHYTIVGDGPDKKYIEDIVQELGLTSCVSLVSKAAEEDKERYLKACDIFIMPSRDIHGDYEGFGIVYLEAGSYKKPVIAGQGGGVSDAVTNDDNGLVVNGEDPTAIAEAILRLYNDNALRSRLGQRGYERSQASSWQARVTTIYSLLRQYDTSH